MTTKCNFCQKEGDFPTGLCDDCGNNLDDYLIDDKTEKEVNQMETQENLLDKPIGTKETEKLKPSKVTIIDVVFKTETKEGKTMDTPLALINVKHPDREEPIPISKIKCEKNGKLQVLSLWVQLEEETGALKKSSTVSALMNFLKVNSLRELTGKEIETVDQSAEDKYLCLKAY